MAEQQPFKWRHFESEIIFLCVCWYLRYSLSYRDLEEIMRERELQVEHTTIDRWVQYYVPLIIHMADSLLLKTFHCYTTVDLPRTNNDLEPCFGSVRAHERRATGRRGAIPGLVVRGSLRVLTTLVTKRQPLQASDLQPTDYQAWRDLHRQLEYRQEAHRQQFRFRKNPQEYLAAIDARLLT